MPDSTPAIKTVGIIGTGLIGASWTTLFLAHGLKVTVTDPAPGAESRLKAYLARELDTMKKIGLREGFSLENVKFVESLEGLRGLDFYQESAPEKLEMKKELYARLDEIVPPHAILASSSSGIPSSHFTQNLKHTGRTLIGHPFNPPHIIPLVEIVPHSETDPNITEQVLSFYKWLGKNPILIRQELPGFIANRLQSAVFQEAYSLVHRGIVSPEDCDIALTSGLGLRWALTGNFLTNTLGGNGDFRYFVDHIGRVSVPWLDDMKQHEFTYTNENVDELVSVVDKWKDQLDLQGIEEERKNYLIDLIKRKEASVHLRK